MWQRSMGCRTKMISMQVVRNNGSKHIRFSSLHLALIISSFGPLYVSIRFYNNKQIINIHYCYKIHKVDFYFVAILLQEDKEHFLVTYYVSQFDIVSMISVKCHKDTFPPVSTSEWYNSS